MDTKLLHISYILFYYYYFRQKWLLRVKLK